MGNITKRVLRLRTGRQHSSRLRLGARMSRRTSRAKMFEHNTSISMFSKAFSQFSKAASRSRPLLWVPRPYQSRVSPGTACSWRDEWTEEQSRKNFQSVSQLVVCDPKSSLFLLHPVAPEAGGDAFHSRGRQFYSMNRSTPRCICLTPKFIHFFRR